MFVVTLLNLCYIVWFFCETWLPYIVVMSGVHSLHYFLFNLVYNINMSIKFVCFEENSGGW